MKRMTHCKCAKCGCDDISFVSARNNGEAVTFNHSLYIEGSTDKLFKEDTFMDEDDIREMITGSESITFMCVECDVTNRFEIAFNNGETKKMQILDGKDILIELLGHNAFHPDTPMWSMIDLYCYMADSSLVKE
jgi:hypothetical protein